MQLIVSRQNKIVKYIKSLKDKKNRKKHGSCLVEGFRFVKEAVMSGAEIEAICFMAGVDTDDRKELEPLLASESCCFEVSPEVFKQLAETDSPQGVVAAVKIPACPLSALYRKGFRALILDSVQDPGNAGTMIRTAHAMGFNAVLTTRGTVDVYNSKVLRATMGSIFYMPMIDGLEKEEIISFCREHCLRLITTTLRNGNPCHQADLSGEFMLVIGNEGKGISPGMESSANESIHIPMPGGAESLNAAVAASVMMYESNRQKTKTDKRQ